MAAKIALEHATPVILLTNAFIGNGSSLWKLPKFADLPEIKPHFVKPGMTDLPATARDAETNARYWNIPGVAGLEHRNGGLEKDFNTGSVSTDALNHQRMVDTRQAKVDYIANVIPDLEVEGNQDADLLVIGWGSTYGHLKTALLNLNEQGKKVALAHFTYINPLPKNTAEIIKKYKKVVVCELNSGQFATFLRTKVPGEYLQFNKVQGQPFSSTELEEHISTLL